MRSRTIRTGALVGALVLLISIAVAACAAPAPAAKVSYSFGHMLYSAPAPGINVGNDAPLIYSASNIPGDGKLVIQRGIPAGKSTKWSTVLKLARQSVGRGILGQPPFGRNTYRIAAFDRAGKLLASSAHTLDVYRNIGFGDIIGQPVRQLGLGGGVMFPYTFRGEIYVGNTTCRSINQINAFVVGSNDRVLTISHRIKDTFTTPARYFLPVNHGQKGTTLFLGEPVPLTIGEDFDIDIADNDLYGTTVYAQGYAQCFTANGQF